MGLNPIRRTVSASLLNRNIPREFERLFPLSQDIDEAYDTLYDFCEGVDKSIESLVERKLNLDIVTVGTEFTYDDQYVTLDITINFYADDIPADTREVLLDLLEERMDLKVSDAQKERGSGPTGDIEAYRWEYEVWP